MVLFNKVGIDLLQELLGQVKGGVYIHETSYEKKTKQLLIAYGTIANSENQVAPFSGISIKVRVISDEELNSVSTMENIKLNGQEIAAPQNIVQLFWTIVSEVSTELESRVQKILSKPQKSAIVVKAVDIVNPFTIDNRSASVRVELMIGEFRYQEELPAFQVFYLGSKGLFNYLILRCLQFLCMRTFEANGKNYIKIPQKAFFNCIPKFMQALSEVGMLEVLLEDEAAISAKLEELQKKILGYVKKDSLEAGLEKNYLISEADDEFLISGLELAFVAYLLLGSADHRQHATPFSPASRTSLTPRRGNAEVRSSLPWLASSRPSRPNAGGDAAIASLGFQEAFYFLLEFRAAGVGRDQATFLVEEEHRRDRPDAVLLAQGIHPIRAVVVLRPRHFVLGGERLELVGGLLPLRRMRRVMRLVEGDARNLKSLLVVLLVHRLHVREFL